MKQRLSLAEALRDPAFLGAPFTERSFAAWHAVSKLISGERLSAPEKRLAKACTGRSKLPAAPVNRLYLLCGRRAGKSRWLSAVAVWVAAFAADWFELLSPGERGIVLLLGTDKKQAAVLSRYCRGLVRTSAELADQVVSETREEIAFKSGATIEIGTNDHALVRSRTCLAICADETCFWTAEGEGSSSDEEVIAAAMPSMMSVPGGGWMVLASSPYRPKGLMHRRWRELFGNDKARELCWVAPSRTMNPTLPKKEIDKALAEDPVRARSEYLAEWRSTDTEFIPDDVIQGCTDWKVRERAPEKGQRYVAFCDAAGGTGQDSFTVAIAGLRPGSDVVLDVLRERKPRFVPAAVVAEYAALLKLYGCTEVHGDQYAKGWVADEWARNGVRYIPSRRTRSEIYLAALPLLLSGRARLLDSQTLRHQLAGLQRTIHSGGRESVNHGNSSLSHDDACNAACGAIVGAADRLSQAVPLVAPIVCFGQGIGAPGGGHTTHRNYF